MDKFGHYKPVLFISLIMNAVFHHSLMLIPQMETPGKIPPAYVMRHPLNGKVEVSSLILSCDLIWDNDSYDTLTQESEAYFDINLYLLLF